MTDEVLAIKRLIDTERKVSAVRARIDGLRDYLSKAIPDEGTWTSTNRQLEELEANLSALGRDLDVLRREISRDAPLERPGSEKPSQ